MIDLDMKNRNEIHGFIRDTTHMATSSFEQWTFIVDPVIFLRAKIPNGFSIHVQIGTCLIVLEHHSSFALGMI